MNKPLIIFDKNLKSLKIKKQIDKIFKRKSLIKKNIVIVIGGDGFMLQTLKKNKKTKKLFYGVNSGNYGFLMNKFSKKFLTKNINKSNMISISPLEMIVKTRSKIRKCLAINEVSILRQSSRRLIYQLKQIHNILLKN